jgi:predicted alpha/beta hydrolase
MLQSAGDQARWQPTQDTENTRQPEADTLESALIRLQRLARPGSLLFLVSDFRGLEFQPGNAAQKLLLRLADHNELLLHHIYDPLEQALPNKGRYPVSDGQQRFMLQPSATAQRHYQGEFASRQQALQALGRRRNVGVLSQTTAQNPLTLLRQTLPARRQ